MFNLFPEAPSQTAQLLGAPLMTGFGNSLKSGTAPTALDIGNERRLGQPVNTTAPRTADTGLAVGTGPLKITLGDGTPGMANQALADPSVRAKLRPQTSRAGLIDFKPQATVDFNDLLGITNGNTSSPRPGVNVTEWEGGKSGGRVNAFEVDPNLWHPLDNTRFLDLGLLRDSYNAWLETPPEMRGAFAWGSVPNEVSAKIRGVPSRNDRTRARALDYEDWARYQADPNNREALVGARQRSLDDVLNAAVERYTHVRPEPNFNRMSQGERARYHAANTGADPYAVWDRWLQTADGQEYQAWEAGPKNAPWHKKRPMSPSELAAQGVEPGKYGDGTARVDPLANLTARFEREDARKAWQDAGADPNALPQILADALQRGEITGRWLLPQTDALNMDLTELLTQLDDPLNNASDQLFNTQMGRWIDPVTGESRVGQGRLIGSQQELDAIMAAPEYRGSRDLTWQGLGGGFDPYASAQSITDNYGLIDPDPLTGQSYTGWDPIANPEGFINRVNAFGWSPPNEGERYATMDYYGIPGLIKIDQYTGEVTIDPTQLMAVAGGLDPTLDPNGAIRYGEGDSAPSVIGGTVQSVMDLLNQAGITGPRSLGRVHSGRILSPESWQEYNNAQADQQTLFDQVSKFRSGQMTLPEMRAFQTWLDERIDDPAENARQWDIGQMTAIDPSDLAGGFTYDQHSTPGSRLIAGVNAGLEGDALRDSVLGGSGARQPWEVHPWLTDFYRSGYGENAIGQFDTPRDRFGNEQTIDHPLLGRVSEETAHNFERWLINNHGKADTPLGKSFADDFMMRYYASLRGEVPRDRLLMPADWRPRDLGKSGEGGTRHSPGRPAMPGVISGDETMPGRPATPATPPSITPIKVARPPSQPGPIAAGPEGGPMLRPDEIDAIMSGHLDRLFPDTPETPPAVPSWINTGHALEGMPPWLIDMILANPELAARFGLGGV